jgi:hypothetical protein
MDRQSQPLTNEGFRDGIFIGTTLRAAWYLIFMRRLNSDCFDVNEWQCIAEAGA